MATTSLQSQTSRTSSGEWLRKLAVERAQILVGCYRKSDVGDPQVYSAAVVAVLVQWPAEVIISVTEPATGIPSRIAWLPSIAEIVSACKDAYEPIRARHEIDKTRKALPPPTPNNLSDAEMDAQFERLGLGHLRPGSKFKLRNRPFSDEQVADAQSTLDRYEREATENQR